MSTRILVTGGAGYIGSAFVHRLVHSPDNKDYEITVIDNLSKCIKSLLPKHVNFIEMDLCDQESLNRFFKKESFSCVAHFAGCKAVGGSEENPSKYLRNNISGMINLLTFTEQAGVKKIIFSSTACVYAERESGVYHEDDELKPLSIYG